MINTVVLIVSIIYHFRPLISGGGGGILSNGRPFD
jgi:hypothetical protein